MRRGLLLLWLLAAALPAAADTATPMAPPAGYMQPLHSEPLPPPYLARLRADTQQVLRGPDFHRQRETQRLVPRDWLRRWLQRDAAPAPAEPPSLPVQAALRLLALCFKLAVVLALVLALGWLLLRGGQWLAARRAAPAATAARPVVAAETLAPAGAALPVDIVPAARAAWQAGNAGLALSLLYRGAVRALAQQYHVALPASATEGECLRLAQRSSAAVVEAAFAPIVQAWMALAYAQRAPADFEHLLMLYHMHFGSRAGEAA